MKTAVQQIEALYAVEPRLRWTDRSSDTDGYIAIGIGFDKPDDIVLIRVYSDDEAECGGYQAEDAVTAFMLWRQARMTYPYTFSEEDM